MKRSKEWPALRKKHLKKYPRCAICEMKTKCEVHHIVPFHLNKSKELDPKNLRTLCENKKNGINCHLAFGHLGNYKSYNKDIIRDIYFWNKKIKNRP